MGSEVAVWGHRGCKGRGNPPENSLAAFAAAIGQGAHGIELDVFLTHDGHLVVFHDDTLERMTNLRGPITVRTLSELQAARLKDASGAPTDERIPTLDQVLDLVARWRSGDKAGGEERARAERFVVNIETKGTGIAIHVARAVEQRLAQGWTPRNFLNSSFDMASLGEMRSALPAVPIGALFAGPAEPWDIGLAELARRIESARALEPDTVNVTYPSLRQAGAPELIAKSGARPVAWTSNEKHPEALSADERRSMAEFLRANGATMITDYPGAMLRVLGQAA
jgi:glycerophosphoryl diester phosphodiesterase